MKRSTLCALAVSALSAAVPMQAYAQDGPAASLGGDAALVIPVGDWADATGVMVGPLVRFEYALSPQLVLTARAGYLYGLRKSTTIGAAKAKYGISDIPLWGGVDYYLAESAQGLYLAGEAGLNLLSFSAELEGDPLFGSTTNSSSETDWGVTAGAGYRMGELDLRGGLVIFDLGHMGDSMGVIASVGYTFAQL